MRVPIKGSSILVTGGAGFIGSHLTDCLISQGASKLIILDNMFLGSEFNLQPAFSKGAQLYRDDLEISTSLDYIFENHHIDLVFNCATKALNYSFLNPSNAYQTNVTAILNLLELLRKEKYGTLCHLSTSEVYGTAIYEPMDENHPLNPTTTYAAGKAAADIALQTYVRMFNLDAFIVRPFNNYGPRQNYSGFLAGVIPTTIRKIIEGSKPEIHGSGKQSREFIYVTDTVNAIVALYDLLKPGESVNIAAENQISIETLIAKICELMGYRGEIAHREARRSDVECHNASLEKINSLINYSLTPLEEGLKETINWYTNQKREKIR